MNAWEPPELTDLKATPAPVKRARNTFDLLGEDGESKVRSAFSTAGVAWQKGPVQTEQRMLDGQLVDVITGSPPPVRRQVSPGAGEAVQQSELGDLPLADTLAEDDIDDPLFEAWTVEPAVQRDAPSSDPRRLAFLLVGIAAVALVGIGVGLTSSTGDEGAAAERASASVALERPVAPPPVEVERPSTPVPSATPALEGVDAPGPAAAPLREVAASEASVAPVASRDEPRPPVEVAPKPAEVSPQVDRSTMYTPSAEPVVAEEEVEVAPAAPVVEPERAQVPETSGTQPWGASPPPPSAPTSGTNPWGIQE